MHPDRKTFYIAGGFVVFLLIVLGISVFLLEVRREKEFQAQIQDTTQKIAAAQKTRIDSYPTDTSTWKTYRNEKYGFGIKMPPRWSPNDIEEVKDVYYGGINIFLRLPTGSSGLRSVCNFSVYKSSEWDRLQKEAETDKPIFLASKNDTTYGWGCGHDDYGYRGFEEYNQAIDNEQRKNLPIGPFEEFKKFILSTFKLIN